MSVFLVETIYGTAALRTDLITAILPKQGVMLQGSLERDKRSVICTVDMPEGLEVKEDAEILIGRWVLSFPGPEDEEEQE